MNLCTCNFSGSYHQAAVTIKLNWQFNLSTEHCQTVEVCEIVAVHKTEDEVDAQARSPPKRINQPSPQYPHAFTGAAVTLLYKFRNSFKALKGPLGENEQQYYLH